MRASRPQPWFGHLDRIVAVLEAEPVGCLPAQPRLWRSKVALPLVRKALGLLPDVGFVNAYGLTRDQFDHRGADSTTA